MVLLRQENMFLSGRQVLNSRKNRKCSLLLQKFSHMLSSLPWDKKREGTFRTDEPLNVDGAEEVNLV